MNTKQELAKVIEVLTKKYSFIPDLKLREADDKIKGGFYWTNYLNGEPYADYPFHETFAYFTDEIDTPEKLIAYISKNIDKQLEWQKWCDEQYAKDFNKEVVYKYKTAGN